MLKKHNQNGFHLIIVPLVVIVLGAIGFAGWKVLSNKKDPITSASTATTVSPNAAGANKKEISYIAWQFNDTTWSASETPPSCEEPLSIGSPTDLSKITGKLLPGEIRGGDYKAHGGLANDNATDDQMNIYAVRDAYLYQGARYMENGTLQYLLDFVSPCGIRFRFDHLAALAPDIAKLAEELPAPKVDDTRTNPITPTLVKRGQLVATAVGHKETMNIGFDLGVYDLRHTNAASETNLYQTESQRVNKKEQSYYGLCWFKYVDEPDRTILLQMPVRGSNVSKPSEFCD